MNPRPKFEPPIKPSTFFAFLCALLTIVVLIAVGIYGVADAPDRFPVVLHGSSSPRIKKEIISINASTSLESIEEAINTVNQIDRNPIFSISNPFIIDRSEISDPGIKVQDRTHLLVLVGENYPLGRSKFIEYTLSVRGTNWVIDKQQEHVVFRDR